MPGTRCLNCRWWTGDRTYAAEAFDERHRRGKCEHVHSSPALREDRPVRLYPVGVNAWMDTRFDFSCRDWEKQR